MAEMATSAMSADKRDATLYRESVQKAGLPASEHPDRGKQYRRRKLPQIQVPADRRLQDSRMRHGAGLSFLQIADDGGRRSAEVHRRRRGRD